VCRCRPARVRAARAQGLLEMDWDDGVGDYRLHAAS